MGVKDCRFLSEKRGERLRREGWREGDKVLLPLDGIWEKRGGGRRKTLRGGSLCSGGGRINFYLVDFLRTLEDGYCDNGIYA